jgi:hypothetical protein
MLVKILQFGSSWWSKAGDDPEDPYRYTRHAAYYNSTGVHCGSRGQKVRHHWMVPGLVRFNGVGGFNPNLPNRAIGAIFSCDPMASTLGGNRLLLRENVRASRTPDYYLVRVSGDVFGKIELRTRRWRSPGASIVAVSQLRDQQEAMLLMKPGDWVRTSAGLWQLQLSSKLPNGAALELIPDEL